MKLYLKGHNERYPVEQLQMQLFGDRPTQFVETPFSGEDGAVSTLHDGRLYRTATAKITLDGKTASASRRIRLEQADVRMTRRILQQSYYLAAVQLLPETPPWGALSGVRPTKLATKALLSGGSEKDAERMLRDVYFVTPERRRLCLDASRHTLEAARLLEPNDLSVYIGIPFCPTRCAYCSFVSESVERFGEFLPPYLDCLLREIEYTGALLARSGWHIRSLYMGGGTPTTLTAEQMDRLLTRLERSFDFTSLAESTIEAGRPDTIDPEKLAVLRAHGVTRVSVNPQTMEDRVLAAIGRRHTADDIRRAMREVMAAGFPHVNMDLIAGLPEDTPEGFRRSLDEVLSMGADSITVHTLSLKKGSRITLEGSRIPSADEVAEMLDYADPTLRKHGFEPYYLYRQKYMSGSFENVGWTRPGGEGLYNIYIMEELHSILSLGAGGSTKMVGGGLIRRAFNAKYPREYIDLAEKRSANLAAFADFYREPEEHT